MNNFPLISGFGVALPERVVTNEEISTFVDTNPEWIKTRTGIECRRFIDDASMGADIGAAAAKAALETSGRTADELTHIIYATCTPDTEIPAGACLVGHRLHTKGQVCFDVNSACTGFTSSLDLARAYIALNPSACILLVASETLSRRCNWEDRTTSILFGDGAGAAIVTGRNTPPASKESLTAKLVDNLMASDGSLANLLVIGPGLTHPPYKLGDTIGAEFFITMQGREVFKHAVRSMANICNDLLSRNHLSIDDIDCLIPHQANMRIIEAVGERLSIPNEKVFVNVHKYGNTSAASIPIALGEAVSEGKVGKGSRVLLTSFGGGFTWGATILQF